LFSSTLEPRSIAGRLPKRKQGEIIRRRVREAEEIRRQAMKHGAEPIRLRQRRTLGVGDRNHRHVSEAVVERL
jgi:hypothetical protein